MGFGAPTDGVAHIIRVDPEWTSLLDEINQGSQRTRSWEFFSKPAFTEQVVGAMPTELSFENCGADGQASKGTYATDDKDARQHGPVGTRLLLVARNPPTIQLGFVAHAGGHSHRRN